jgi:trans-aconitate methyltransferase
VNTSPRPAHLTPENAARFTDASVVERYGFRLPYSQQIFEILAALAVDEPRAALDVGCGRGEIARPLAALVDRVDAVDVSAPMIARGKTLPGGDHPRLRWIHGRVEDVPLQPPYALITAGSSLHWMDWEVVLPRFGRLLTAHGVLAIVNRGEQPLPWADGIRALIRRFSTMSSYQPFDLIAELTGRGLFEQTGEQTVASVSVLQSVDDYLAALHSHSSLSLDRMPRSDAEAFDAAVRELVRPWSAHGQLELQVTGGVVWGQPLPGDGDRTSSV